MEFFQSKHSVLPGTSYSEVYSTAYRLYQDVKKKSKRRPYIRSKYFKGEKIFLDYFWKHIHEKNRNDRLRRLRLYACALDLIKQSRNLHSVRPNPNKLTENVYRFKGRTRDGGLFWVQVKKSRKGQKSLISVFPDK